MINRTVSHYNVIEKIGEGGMGEVYLAEDTNLRRKVAIKVLPEHLQQDETAHKRFLREARSAAALDHPYICNIHEVGQTDRSSLKCFSKGHLGNNRRNPFCDHSLASTWRANKQKIRTYLAHSYLKPQFPYQQLFTDEKELSRSWIIRFRTRYSRPICSFVLFRCLLVCIRISRFSDSSSVSM